MWHPGKFEPIVDSETFQAVREKLGSDFKTYHKPELTYAGGLITCAHCGRIVTGEKKVKTSPDGTKRVYNYYRCSHYTKEGHPKSRLNETEVDRQLLALFASIKLDDEARKWFVDVIRARAHAGQADNKHQREELRRQHDQVAAKLTTLLELRMDGEIDQAEYAAKRTQLQDRQAGIRVQLETADRDGNEIAELAIQAFELSQSLAERWVKADYKAKRTILSVMLETVRLNSENLEYSLRKPFVYLRDVKLVPLNGGGGI